MASFYACALNESLRVNSAACLNADTPQDFLVLSVRLFVSAPQVVIMLGEWFTLAPMAFQTWLAWFFTLLVPRVQIAPTGKGGFSPSMDEPYAFCLPLNVPGDILTWMDSSGLLASRPMQSCPSLSKMVLRDIWNTGWHYLKQVIGVVRNK